MKTPLWGLLTALLRLLCVQGASDDETPVPECSDESVRLDSSSMGPSNTVYSTILSGEIGDVQGIINVCEEQQWKNVVVCNEEMWTMMNTVAACRDLGYATAASFEVHDNQVIGQSSRLSYIPDCTGDEERLVDCDHNDHDDDCSSPVVISCWNSSVDTSQPPPVIHSATPLIPISPQPTLFTDPAVSSLTSSQSNSIQSSSSTTQHAADPTTPSTDISRLTTPSPTLHSGRDPPPVGDDESSSVPHALYGTVGAGIVILLAVVGIAVVLVVIGCRRKSAKPHLVQDQPYEVPVPVVKEDEIFHHQRTDIPETEILYDKTTVLAQTEQSHTLNHSPVSSSSPALSHSSSGKTSSTTIPPNEALYEKVLPTSSCANLSRDPPKGRPPVYYHVLENRPRMPHYHVLEEQPSSRGEPMYHEVGQRGALRPAPAAYSVPSLTLALPQQHRRSVTLL